MSDPIKVGFYVRNAFQVSHLRPLFRETPGATWLLSSARDAEAFGIHNERFVAKRILMRRLMAQYDLIVAHGGPPRGKPLADTPFVMVQYGYAKEPYNFGDWRAQADAICAYGDYAVERFSKHAPSFAIGNPLMDDWQRSGFVDEARAVLPALDANRPVLLYAPTWGELSSLPAWGASVVQLADHYTVLIKAHHNSVRDGQMREVASHPHVHDVSAYDLMQALAVSDVLLSDYSGAIFDAIMCDRPVVLLDVPEIEAQFGKKLDGQSLEMAQRDALGLRADDPAELAGVVRATLDQGPQVDPALQEALFAKPTSVAQAFLDLLPQIIASKG